MKSNSKAVARTIALYEMSEPVSTTTDGIYLGKTMVYRLPFYLDNSNLINPHMAIIGTSGAGKSYMLKSFVAKSVLHNRSRILAIDWNDEYRELTEFLSGTVLSFGRDFRINIMDVYAGPGGIANITELIDSMVELDRSQKSDLHNHLLALSEEMGPKNLKTLISRTKSENVLLSSKLLQLKDNPFFADNTEFDMSAVLDGIYSINLSTLRDSSQRGQFVKFILKLVIDCMHGMRIDGQKQRILVLDEAWRLLKNSDEVGTLYREGRKYGISVISATQLASDINNEIMANVGCLAIFRLQNEKDYGILENAGLISPSTKDVISSLGVGSCMLCLAYKRNSASPPKFYIEKISGIEFGSLHFSGGKMKHQISYRKFIDVTGLLLNQDLRERVASFAIQNGKNIEISTFVGFLTEMGLNRTSVVCYLRQLGIDDLTIVNAYENA